VVPSTQPTIGAWYDQPTYDIIKRIQKGWLMMVDGFGLNPQKTVSQCMHSKLEIKESKLLLPD
jgi:hypothetical protein